METRLLPHWANVIQAILAPIVQIAFLAYYIREFGKLQKDNQNLKESIRELSNNVGEIRQQVGVIQGYQSALISYTPNDAPANAESSKGEGQQKE
jgi:hypothetical protein